MAAQRTRSAPAGNRRRPPATLDRPTIHAAALALADRKGLAGLNMRALADDLGVGTMSLYHWVPSKDALLDGVVEALLAEIEIPAATGSPWSDRVLRMARSLREVGLRHPNCVPLMVTRPFRTSASLAPCNAAFGLLEEAGLAHDDALIAFRTIVAYVLGFVMMETSGFFGGVSADRDPDELIDLGLSHLAAIVPHLTGRDIGADFDTGLRMIQLGALDVLVTGRVPPDGD